MRKWKKLAFLFAASAMLLSACSNNAATNTSSTEGAGEGSGGGQRSQVLFGTGTPGGVYEILGTGMVNILNQNLTDVEMVAVTPAQIQQLPAMIQSGEAALGIGMACMFERAYNGEQEFTGNAQTDIVQVCGMYDNVMGLIALGSSPINSVEDITEDTVIASTATNRFVISELLKAAGKDPENMDYRVMSYSQAAEALGDGNADVAFLTAYPYNGTLDSVWSTKDVKFLSMTEETRNNYNEANPRNLMKAVPAGTYAGQEEEHWSPTVYTVLYANKNVSEDIVYETVATLIEHVDEIAVIHPSGADITLETTQRYLDDGIMSADRMHPGALKYFSENGVE